LSSEKNLFTNRIYLWFTQRNLHHVVLWILYYLFWALFFKPGDSTSDVYIHSIVIVSIHAMVSYFNIYFLFPQLLRRRYYLAYIFSIALAITLGSFIQAGVLMGLNTLDATDKPDLLSFGFILGNSVGILYTTAITMSLKMVKHWYENERLARELSKLNTETELKYLKSQINPHFLFNSLNSIYALSLKKSDRAPELILKLSDILRYLLYDGSEKMVGLDQEVKYLRSYLELEKVRHGERMDLEISVNGDMSAHEIAPMLLIPFVENSFKHGLSKDRSKGFVRVQLSIEDGVLKFGLSNSKPADGGVSNNDGYKGGIGLKNVRKRLQLLYPQRHQLDVFDTEDQFNIRLELKL
jgi:sensor histidine kinase YesM